MKLLIFGANGPTGRLLTAQALAAGHTVTAFTRHADAFPSAPERLRIVQGDALDAAAVVEAVAGQDAVLSAIGTRYSRKPITLYSESTANMLQAMRDHGVRRVVCVSSSVTDPETRSRNTGGGVVFEKMLKPFFTNVVGKSMYADLLRMERLSEIAATASAQATRRCIVEYVRMRPHLIRTNSPGFRVILFQVGLQTRPRPAARKVHRSPSGEPRTMSP